MTGAHPRAGGDGLGVGLDLVEGLGSPPRRRGRRGPSRIPSWWPGLTPAQAGTASVRPGGTCPSRAHPRAGGDGRPSEGRWAGYVGSPPRRRGRRLPHGRHRTVAGLTPAQAGTANTFTTTSAFAGAHPRAGGDGHHDVEDHVWALGSPPRRRGRRQPPGGSIRRRGLTPAQAGTAALHPSHEPIARAHPRAGGDGPLDISGKGSEEGSPPRRRGRPPVPEGASAARGLTPAQAGTARRRRAAGPTARAHPRAGGDG